jgi:hypothetical protein
MGRGGDRKNTRGIWGDKNPMDTGTNTLGAEKQNGKGVMDCTSCGWNSTHMSGYHGKWSRNQATFRLPATHLFWTKSGDSPLEAKTPPPAPAAASFADVSQGQLNNLTNWHKTETEDGAFASFLNKFEGLLN